MGKYDIDKELFIKWFEDKTIKIAEMKTKEELEKRIIEIYNIEFYCKYEWAMLHQQWDKIAGRHGIPPHIKEHRDSLITDPNIQVNWEGEPRKPKEKKPKQDLFQDMFGISIKELNQQVKEQNQGFVAPEKPEKKQTLEEALAEMSFTKEPTVQAPKITSDEAKDKAAAIKEKIRLAKERKASGQ